MPRPMTAKDFNKLSKRDFDNGAITDEIHAALKDREELQAANALLRTQLAEVQGRVVEWKEGCRELPEFDEGKQYIVYHNGKIKHAYDGGDEIHRNLTATVGGEFITWPFVYYLPLSALPLPKE